MIRTGMSNTSPLSYNGDIGSDKDNTTYTQITLLKFFAVVYRHKCITVIYA